MIFSSLLLMSSFSLILKIFYLLRLTYLARLVSGLNCLFSRLKYYFILWSNFFSPLAVWIVKYFAVSIADIIICAPRICSGFLFINFQSPQSQIFFSGFLLLCLKIVYIFHVWRYSHNLSIPF